MMLSPFPGMNPYLEGEMWMEFHDRLAGKISEQLMPKLSPKYVALLAKYHAVSSGLALFGEEQGALYPDVHITQISPFPMSNSGGVAVMEPTATLQSSSVIDVPIPYIEIRDVANRQLVTIIEILSPANKIGQGFFDYTEKRNQILNSETHLVEIDLVRRGHRLELDGRLPAGDYYVYVSDSRREKLTDIWAIDLRDRLPTIPVPLRSPDSYVALDLQAAVDDCYRTVPYNMLLDYDQLPPTPRLDSAERKWIKLQIETFREMV